MKAVFIHYAALLRDSGIEPQTADAERHLVPATLEALRTLSSAEDTLLFLYGYSGDGAGEQDQLEALVQQVEAGGGRIDGLITCPHRDGKECGCWGQSAGTLREAARRFALRLNECYVIGDSLSDVTMAYATGARPIIPLGRRNIGDVLGKVPKYKDFPISTDMGVAVSYIASEEEISRQLGRPRTSQIQQNSALASSGGVPTISVISPMARSLQMRLDTSQTQLRDLMRWLSFFVVGAVGLSLGIAYLLTHLYRVQPFPEFVYYLTLQFIPRPLRGLLFIIWGLAVILLAGRSYYRKAIRSEGALQKRQ